MNLSCLHFVCGELRGGLSGPVVYCRPPFNKATLLLLLSTDSTVVLQYFWTRLNRNSSKVWCHCEVLFLATPANMLLFHIIVAQDDILRTTLIQTATCRAVEALNFQSESLLRRCPAGAVACNPRSLLMTLILMQWLRYSQ